jgi:hypothetical protein
VESTWKASWKAAFGCHRFKSLASFFRLPAFMSREPLHRQGAASTGCEAALQTETSPGNFGF